MLFRHHKVIHECIEGIFRGIDVHNICEGKLLFTRICFFITDKMAIYNFK